MSLLFFIAPYQKKIVPPCPYNLTSFSILNLSIKPVSSSSSAATLLLLLLLLLYQLSLYPIQLVLKYLYGNFQQSWLLSYNIDSHIYYYGHCGVIVSQMRNLLTLILMQLHFKILYLPECKTGFFVCFFVGNSPASEFYMPTFQNTLFVPSS
jgi:hypothetical protein